MDSKTSIRSKLLERISGAKVYVFVGSFQGVVETVEVCSTIKGAEGAFQHYTGESYRDLLKKLRKRPDLTPAHILGENLDECKIFETIIR